MPLINGNNQDDVSRLRTAINSSREHMHRILQDRKEVMAAYQGPRFSDRSLPRTDSSDPRISIPMMAIAIELYEQLLAGETVRSLVTSRRQKLAPIAEALKFAGDLLVDAIDLSSTFREWVKEAAWGCGVVKVGRTDERSLAVNKTGGLRRKISIPFADLVDTPDLVLDTEAPSWERMKYMGDAYLVPLDWAKKQKGFKAEARRELQPISATEDKSIDSSASPIPRTSLDNDLFQMTRLIDVYFPWDNTIMTIGETGPRMALKTEKFDGPSIGPYHPLIFERVRDSVIGKPMAFDWIDCHHSINVLYNKAVRQHQSAKRNPTIPAGSEKDAERLKNAGDGEWVPIANPAAQIDTFVLPGADPTLVSFIGQLISVFSYISGNINLLGGLQAQSTTLGQDQLLRGAGSRRMAELQRRAKRAFAGVMQSLFWYLFEQENLSAEFQEKVGMATITHYVQHADVKGRLMEFSFEVEPIRHKAPDERLGLLLEWIGKVLLPMRADMAASGQRIDMIELNKIGRDYGDLPELDRLIKNLGRSASPEEMAMLSGKQARTNQTQVRRSEAAPQGLLQGAGTATNNGKMGFAGR